MLYFLVWQTHVKKTIKYFKEYFGNNKNQIKFITQEYENILNNYNVFFKEFSINKYSKIKNLFNKNKDKGYGIIVLMILYMGKDKTISIVFKEILINPNSKEEIERGINKTNLIYRLARKYIKHINLIESIDGDKNINNICSFKELKELSKNLSEIDLVHLGDTLFSLIKNGSEIFTLKSIKERNSAEILVKINPSYYNSFIVSSVNITQLPMIFKPRDIDMEGLYFPYVLTQSNVLNLNENKIIRSKYEQRYKKLQLSILNLNSHHLSLIPTQFSFISQCLPLPTLLLTPTNLWRALALLPPSLPIFLRLHL